MKARSSSMRTKGPEDRVLLPLKVLSTPELAPGIGPSDLIAALALLVAVVSAVVTWRVHQDAAGRVKVKLLSAYYCPFAGTGSFHRETAGSLHHQETQEAAVEVCEVVIENPGRTGVTVTGVALRIDKGTSNKYTVTPRSFILEGFADGETNGDTYFRLDAYDRRTVLFDYWSVVDASFKENPELREIYLSAEVTVAGHDHPFDSKDFGYWRISRETISSIGSGRYRRPRNMFLLEMLRWHSNKLNRSNYLGRVAVEIEESLDFPASAQQWEGAIDTALDSFDGEILRRQLGEDTNSAGYIGGGLAAFHLAEQSELYGAQFEPFPRRPRPPRTTRA